jgi:hypothetical protein
MDIASLEPDEDVSFPYPGPLPLDGNKYFREVCIFHAAIIQNWALKYKGLNRVSFLTKQNERCNFSTK